MPRPDDQLRILEADILRVFRTRGEAAALAICTGELAVWSRALVQQDKRRIEAERQLMKATNQNGSVVSPRSRTQTNVSPTTSGELQQWHMNRIGPIT